MVTKEEIILITGASGFIGTNLVELFEEKGYRFVNYDKADVTKVDQRKYWYEGNIMDKVGLSAASKYMTKICIYRYHLERKSLTAQKQCKLVHI